jgi:transposase
LAAKHLELERLESIPGVGRLTAMTFVLTLKPVERFAHNRDVAGSWGCGRSASKQRATRS